MKHVMTLDDGTQVAIDPTTSTVEISKDAGVTWKSIYEPKATRTESDKKS